MASILCWLDPICGDTCMHTCKPCVCQRGHAYCLLCKLATASVQVSLSYLAQHDMLGTCTCIICMPLCVVFYVGVNDLGRVDVAIAIGVPGVSCKKCPLLKVTLIPC